MPSIEFRDITIDYSVFLTNTAFISTSNFVACQLDRYCYLSLVTEVLPQYLQLIAITVVLFVVSLKLRL